MTGIAATPTPAPLLQIVVGERSYFVDPADIDWMRAYHHAQQPAHDARRLPIIYADLAALLSDAAPHVGSGHILGIHTRRRSIALIVQRVEALVALPTAPLAPLLADRLRRPWVRGVALDDNQPVVVLDLRKLALDALTIKRQ